MFKKGFTLAEVLITLAIIGIVAALTIPTLIQNYQERAWNTASQVFQRKLEESLKVMNTQGTLAGYSSTEAFVNELSKHIKITKVCKNDDITSCFADKVYWGAENEEIDMTKIKTSKNFGQDNWDTETIGLQFANGVNAVVAYNPDCHQDPYSNQIIGSDCLAILYDVDGFKNPNTSGKDLRSINVASLGGGCYKEINGLCILSAAFQPSPVTKEECEQLVKDGYGIQGCAHSEDYWAGAVKQCEDMGGSLPDKNQLAEVATYLYGVNVDASLGNDENTYAALDKQKAGELGIGALLWAKEEYIGSYPGDTFAVYSFGYGRSFYDNYTCYGYYYCGGYSNGRSLSRGKALCIEN